LLQLLNQKGEQSWEGVSRPKEDQKEGHRNGKKESAKPDAGVEPDILLDGVM
jgi:hypothetical protein